MWTKKNNKKGILYLGPYGRKTKKNLVRFKKGDSHANVHIMYNVGSGQTEEWDKIKVVS